MIRKTSSVIVSSMLLISAMLVGINLLPLASLAETNEPWDGGDGLDPVADDNEWNTNGSWWIDNGDIIVHENKTIIVNGNLTVNGTGSLTLINVTLKINSPVDGNNSIIVQNGGTLIIRDFDLDPLTTYDASNITSLNPPVRFSFGIYDSASTFEMRNSRLQYCGFGTPIFWQDFGLYIDADFAVVEDNYISDCYRGVVIRNCNNATIENNTFENIDNIGVYSTGVDYCYIRNNTLSNVGNFSLYFYSSIYLNISYNNITNNPNAYGISLDGGGGHDIYNNTLDDNVIGIFLHGDLADWDLLWCDVHDNEIMNNGRGIHIQGLNGMSAVQYIYVYDNDIYSNTDYGIILYGASGPYAVNSISIYDNEVYNNDGGAGEGIRFTVNAFGDVGYIFCRYNEVKDNTGSGYYLYGVIDISIRDEYIARNDINLEVRSSDYVFVTNSTIEKRSLPSGTDIELDKPLSSSPPAVYLLNTTFDESEAYVTGSDSLLNVRWYLHVRVLQQGLSVDNADVWINNSQTDPEPSTGQPLNTGFGNDGWIRDIEVTEFNMTNIGSDYYTPHQIEAANGTITGWAEAGMDMSKEVIVILDTFPNADTIDITAPTVYRTNTVYITANGSDYEDTEDELTPHLEYDPPGGPGWEDIYMGAPSYNVAGFWEAPFTPPSGADLGDYFFRVQFNDTAAHYSGWLNSVGSLEVLNNPPTADAGWDDTASAGIPYIFDDSGSTDIENPAGLSYAWDINESDGLNWSPADYNVSSPSHTYWVPGVYIATLNVTDLDGDWHLDTVTITVVDSTPPVVDAGENATVKVDTSHDLNGSLSYDNVGIVWYNWSFGDGQYDNGTNITTNHTYTAEGIYIVTLNCSDAVGLWSTDTVTITVNPSDPPVANAGPNNSTNEGSPIIFNGSLSTDDFSVVNFTWDIDESDGLDFNNPTFWGEEITYTYNIPGIYIVTLKVTDEHGGWDLDNLTVIVIDLTPPNAVAIIPTPIDEDTSYMFDGSGSWDNSGFIAYYNWTWGDGNFTFGTDPQPSYNYTEPGWYLVTLNISDAAGLWNTSSELIEVKDITSPVANAGPPNSTNEDSPVYFDGSGSYDNVGIEDYFWDTDASDGLDWVTPDQTGIKPSHLYSTPGFYTVTLNCTDVEGNWAHDTTTINVIDITVPTANAGPDATVDEDSPHTFDGSGSWDNVGIDSFAWDIDNSDGVDWVSPDYIGMNPSHEYADPGTYIATLNVTDTMGYWMTDTVIINVTDITRPVADAGPPDDSVDNGTTYAFDGSASWDNSGFIAFYNWSFDDGNFDNGTNVTTSHKYAKPGKYVVTLTVTDKAGNSGTDIINITVKDIMNPVADAGLDDVVDEDALYIFDASNSYDDAGITEYAWDMDASDGVNWATPDYSGPTLSDPMHTYTIPGTYLVTLNVTDGDGNWDTDTVYITVRDITSPVAIVGPDDTTNEDTAYLFDGTGSSDNSGSISYYNWSFGDGQFQLGMDPQPLHTYVQPGDYTIILNVTDAAGNWDTDTMLLTVLDTTLPFASAGLDDTIDEDEPYMLDGSASFDNVGIDNYAWDIDDGDGVDWVNPDYSGPGISTPVHTYLQPGTFTVTLKVTDAAGNSDTDTVVITVEDVTNPAPDAGSDDTVNEDTSYTFYATGSSDNVGITSYAWDIDAGDGLNWNNPDYTEISPTHVYSEPGVYIVTLKVTDAAENWALTTLAITVIDTTSPTADAGSDDSVNEDSPFMFNASASGDNVGITSYAWDVDASDGIDWSSPDYSDESPTHIYSEPGIYTVTLNVTDGQGNRAMDTMVIEVYDVTPPTLSVIFPGTMDEDLEYEFDASGSSDDVGITSYNFTFGDGFHNLGTDAIVTHTYVDPGIYIFIVTVTDTAGNGRSNSWPVTINDITHPLTPSGLAVSKVPAGGALNISWNLNTEEDIYYYELYYSDDGQNFELVDNITQGISYYMHTGLINGKNYWYYLVAVDDAGLSSEPTRILLGNPDRDLDDNGIYDIVDDDDDGDGWNDITDEFPNDPSEWADYDEDGTGDNADDDDDNDDVLDVDDAFPFDSTETMDFDEDGIGNNADYDDDNDGVSDGEDDFPLDPKRSKVDFDFMSILFILIAIIAIVAAAILGGSLSRQKRRNNTLSMKLKQYEQVQARQPQILPPVAQPILKPLPPPPPVSQLPPKQPPVKEEETLQPKEATVQAAPPAVPIIPALAPEKPEEQEPLEEESKPTEEPAPETTEAEEEPKAEESAPETEEIEEQPQAEESVLETAEVEEPTPETTEAEEQPKTEESAPETPEAEEKPQPEEPVPEEGTTFELMEDEEKPAEPEKKVPPRPPKGRKPPRPPKKMLKKKPQD